MFHQLADDMSLFHGWSLVRGLNSTEDTTGYADDFIIEDIEVFKSITFSIYDLYNRLNVNVNWSINYSVPMTRSNTFKGELDTTTELIAQLKGLRDLLLAAPMNTDSSEKPATVILNRNLLVSYQNGRVASVNVPSSRTTIPLLPMTICMNYSQVGAKSPKPIIRHPVTEVTNMSSIPYPPTCLYQSRILICVSAH